MVRVVNFNYEFYDVEKSQQRCLVTSSNHWDQLISDYFFQGLEFTFLILSSTHVPVALDNISEVDKSLEGQKGIRSPLKELH